MSLFEQHALIGLVQMKMKILPSITVLTLMFFQISRTFVHLPNKNEGIVYIKTFIGPNIRLAIEMPLYFKVKGFIHVLVSHLLVPLLF